MLSAWRAPARCPPPALSRLSPASRAARIPALQHQQLVRRLRTSHLQRQARRPVLVVATQQQPLGAAADEGSLVEEWLPVWQELRRQGFTDGDIAFLWQRVWPPGAGLSGARVDRYLVPNLAALKEEGLDKDAILWLMWMEPKLLATPRAALQGALAALRPLAERYLHPLYAPAGYTLLGAVLAWCPGEAAPLLHRAAELHRSAEQRQMARAGPRLSPPKPAGKLKAKAAVFGRPPPLQQLPLPWPLVVRLARALSPRFLVPRAASVRARAVFLLVRRPNLLAFRLSGGEHSNLLTASPDEFCRRAGCTPEELRKFERRWPG